METFQGGVTRLARVEFLLHQPGANCLLFGGGFAALKVTICTVPIHAILDRFF